MHVHFVEQIKRNDGAATQRQLRALDREGSRKLHPKRAQSRKEKAKYEDSGLWQVFSDVINLSLVNIKSLDLFLLEAQDISVAECTL